MTRSVRRVGLPAVAALAAALVAACAGPPFPAPIRGEPACADVEIGAARTKLQGGLLYPVRLRVLDGKKPVFTLVLDGSASRTKEAHTLLVDGNEKYTLEWAQCVSERAPQPAGAGAKPVHPVHGKARGKGAGTGYECGEANVYKTESLVTTKGDEQSHVVTFAAPPNAACWTGEVPGAPAAPPAAPSAAAPTPTAAPSAP